MGCGENIRQAECELKYKTRVGKEFVFLQFAWDSWEYGSPDAPRAGQFFMIKPRRTGVFLGRPISCAYLNQDGAGFLVARRGAGTRDLCDMVLGEKADLIGPLGNAWTDFLPETRFEEEWKNVPFGEKPPGFKPILLVAGGIGIAPMTALLHENKFTGRPRDFAMIYGLRTEQDDLRWEEQILGIFRLHPRDMTWVTEDGSYGRKGRVTDFLEPEKYSEVCACGPEPMLKAVAEKCAAAGVRCLVSLERRMACGVGACLGCTVVTKTGNRRCCADGPIFDASEVIFDG